MKAPKYSIIPKPQKYDVLDGTYTVTAMKETIERSNIGLLKEGDKVNVERSMMMNGRLDGHIVQGHVDQTAECVDIKDAEGSWYFTFKYKFDKEMAKRGYLTVDKGSVTVSGSEGYEAYIGGLVGRGATGIDKKLTKSYNKGKVSVSIKGGTTYVGGIAGETYDMQNCYNTAAVASTAKGDHIMIGGIAGHADVMGGKITSCYNTGKITGETQFRGSILGTYSGADVVRERNIYNNYYTSSAKAYGNSYITWKDWTAKATKVSAITASSSSFFICSAL